MTSKVTRIIYLTECLVNGGKFLKTVYFIQTHNYWQNWLFFLGWVFTFLAVFEPSYKGEDDFFDHNDGYYTICIWTESIILFCFLLELFMDLFHRRNNPHLSFTDKYINNFKVFSKIILISLFSIDFIVFHASLPHVVYRFSRLFRPCNVILL